MIERSPLHYIEQGSGVPLVLFHAFPLSGAMWHGEMKQLHPLVRVIAPDLPGFGSSARLPQPSIAGMAQAVATLLDRLNIREPALIAGLSMGGYVAFEFLRQFPTRVKALGLFSTRAAADSPQQRQGRLNLIERLKKEGIEVLIQSTLPKLLGPTTMRNQPTLVSQVEQAIRQATVEGITDALQAMADRRDSGSLLAGIACSTLVMAGAEDTLIPAQEGEGMAKSIPGARLEIIPQAGHLMNLEQPDTFQSVIGSWIRHIITKEERHDEDQRTRSTH